MYAYLGGEASCHVALIEACLGNPDGSADLLPVVGKLPFVRNDRCVLLRHDLEDL